VYTLTAPLGGSTAAGYLKLKGKGRMRSAGQVDRLDEPTAILMVQVIQVALGFNPQLLQPF
jgi:hypothetical protein